METRTTAQNAGKTKSIHQCKPGGMIGYAHYAVMFTKTQTTRTDKRRTMRCTEVLGHGFFTIHLFSPRTAVIVVVRLCMKTTTYGYSIFVSRLPVWRSRWEQHKRQYS